MCATDWALKQCMFYIQYLYGDRQMHKVICDCTPLPPRGPCSGTCCCTPSPHSTFYRVWFTVLYLWANRPKLTALEKAHRCTLKVHRSVTHIAQPLSAAQSSSPRTLIVSMVHRCTRSPTLNMEMLWKQNLNIYIRCLWKRGYALLFIRPPCCMYFLCSGWRGWKGEKRETGLRRVERGNLLKRLKLYINR